MVLKPLVPPEMIGFAHLTIMESTAAGSFGFYKYVAALLIDNVFLPVTHEI